jgi:NADH-quinone oxidoreductase subunit N
MNSNDMVALSPLLIVATSAVMLLLLVAFYRNDRLTALITLLGLALSMLALPVASSRAPRQVTPLLTLDNYALYYMGLLFAGCFAVSLLSYGYLKKHDRQRDEFYVLLLVAALGSAVLVASDHFASFFLGLEILSVSLYALIAYPRASQQHIEAAVKYLVLAGASAAFLLFGMALIYAETGTMKFARMSSASLTGGDSHNALLLAGWGMIMVGVGFKLAVVPFHLWTPDVYEGAPAPVAAFVATVSKGSMFALLVRYFTQANIQAYGAPFVALAVIAVASMFAGNLLALLQNNIKRLLAYSSIAHLGYLLVALLASGTLAATAVGFYLAAYFVTMLGAFGVVATLSIRARDADAMSDYQGLFWRRPWLAAIFTAMLLSLAGIPLTAGFVGKFYIIAAGVHSALWLLVLILVVNSAIGLFYYLRVVVAMFGRAPDGERSEITIPAAPLSWIDSVVLAALAFLLLWLGIYPSPIITLIEKTVGGQI